MTDINGQTPWGFGLAAWRALGEQSAVRIWGNELANAVKSPFDKTIWSLLGHGIVIQHNDVDVARELMNAVALESGMDFVYVPREQVVSESQSWISKVRQTAPTLIYLEAGRWLSASPDDEIDMPTEPSYEASAGYAIRGALADLFDGLARESPVVFVTSLECMSSLDANLRREGRFDRWITVPRLSDESLARVFVHGIGGPLLASEVLENLPELGAILRLEFPTLQKQCLLRQAVRRLFSRRKRPVALLDLLEFAAYGTAEQDEKVHTEKECWSTAVHEAGHILVSWLDSRERIPPSYASIKHVGNRFGIVVPSPSSHERSTEDCSFRDVSHQIRVFLGGRAAEHLVLGLENASAQGAEHDLERAASHASRLFTYAGHPTTRSSGQSATLDVSVVLGKPSPSEYAYIEPRVREFLSEQYSVVLELLKGNGALLNRIATALVRKKTLLQADIQALADT